MGIIRSVGKRIPGLHRAYLWYVDFSERRRLKGRAPEKVFKEIYQNNRWGSNESISGPGSAREQAKLIADKLPLLLNDFGVKTILDIPCGDFNWLKDVDLSGFSYIGADIVDEIVEKNNSRFQDAGIAFEVINLLSDELPAVDLIFCRDCLVHFSLDDVRKALENISRSGSKFLLTTSFPEHAVNQDILTGQWRPLNLQAEPFSFPAPLAVINEACTEGEGAYADKSLCLWRISDVAEIWYAKHPDSR